MNRQRKPVCREKQKKGTYRDVEAKDQVRGREEPQLPKLQLKSPCIPTVVSFLPSYYGLKLRTKKPILNTKCH